MFEKLWLTNGERNAKCPTSRQLQYSPIFHFYERVYSFGFKQITASKHCKAEIYRQGRFYVYIDIAIDKQLTDCFTFGRRH